jgi:ABC-type multidrug transport system fused ATPase/permease subunit
VFASAAFKGQYDVGLIGFALVYTLSLSGLAQWSVRQSAEVENQMTAMERISTYAHLPPEQGYHATYDGQGGGAEQSSQQQQQAKYTAATTIDYECKGNKEDDSRASLSAPASVPVSSSSGIMASDGPAPSVELTSTSDRDGGVTSSSGGGGGGSIDIRGLSVTYREDLPPVLQQLDIHIWAGCKAGIVGRTGSGE